MPQGAETHTHWYLERVTRAAAQGAPAGHTDGASRAGAGKRRPSPFPPRRENALARTSSYKKIQKSRFAKRRGPDETGRVVTNTLRDAEGRCDGVVSRFTSANRMLKW